MRKLAMVVAGALSVGGIIGLASPANAATPARCYYSGTAADCYQVTSTAQSTFYALYTDGVINSTGQTANLTCKVEQANTIGWSASASVSASVGIAIVGDMDVQVSATVTGSQTSTIGTSVSVAVPPNHTTYCDRGTYLYRGSVTHTGSRGQTAIPTTYFTETAPSTQMWRFR